MTEVFVNGRPLEEFDDHAFDEGDRADALREYKARRGFHSREDSGPQHSGQKFMGTPRKAKHRNPHFDGVSVK